MTRKVTKTWVTASGDRVRICDMTDGHLMNAIRFCYRWAALCAEQEEKMLRHASCFLQGEEALRMMDDSLDSLELGDGTSFEHPLLDYLQTELQRRGLTYGQPEPDNRASDRDPEAGLFWQGGSSPKYPGG